MCCSQGQQPDRARQTIRSLGVGMAQMAREPSPASGSAEESADGVSEPRRPFLPLDIIELEQRTQDELKRLVDSLAPAMTPLPAPDDLIDELAAGLER